MRDDSERLKDILEAINQIERYSLQERDRFEQEELANLIYPDLLG